MGQIILRLIGALVLLAGITLIYDARIITKKMFGFGDQNEATSGFKILGAIIAVVGAVVAGAFTAGASSFTAGLVIEPKK